MSDAPTSSLKSSEMGSVFDVSFDGLFEEGFDGSSDESSEDSQKAGKSGISGSSGRAGEDALPDGWLTRDSAPVSLLPEEIETVFLTGAARDVRPPLPPRLSSGLRAPRDAADDNDRIDLASLMAPRENAGSTARSRNGDVVAALQADNLPRAVDMAPPLFAAFDMRAVSVAGQVEAQGVAAAGGVVPSAPAEALEPPALLDAARPEQVSGQVPLRGNVQRGPRSAGKSPGSPVSVAVIAVIVGLAAVVVMGAIFVVSVVVNRRHQAGSELAASTRLPAAAPSLQRPQALVASAKGLGSKRGSVGGFAERPDAATTGAMAATEAVAAEAEVTAVAEKPTDSARPAASPTPAEPPPMSGAASSGATKTAAASATKRSKRPGASASSSGTSRTSAFNRKAASASIASLKAAAAACKRAGGPTGNARVAITFAPSGRVTVATIMGPPFAGTAVGGCVASRMRRAKVPAFSGKNVTVATSVPVF